MGMNEVHLLGVDNTGKGLGTKVNPASEETLKKLQGFDIPAYDYIGLTYSGSSLIGVVYKTGGSSGTTVATLTLAYSGSNLISVTKT